MLKNTYEKGKLVEKSGRKATNLHLPHSGGYGRRAAMEKTYSSMPILPG
jgi:hypothetical protein